MFSLKAGRAVRRCAPPLFRCLLLLLPVCPSILTTGMTSSDNGALGSVSCSHGSDCGTGCCTLSLRVGGLLLLSLRLLLGWWRRRLCLR